MKKRNILFGLLVWAIILGCGTNDVTPDFMYLKETIDPTCFKDQFEYEGGRLTSFKHLFGERVSTITKFKYQNNLLKQIESESDNGGSYTVELDYNSDLQRVGEKITFTGFKGTGEQITITKISDFTYDDKGNLRTKNSSFSDSTYSFPTVTEFEWSNGNLVKINFATIYSFGKISACSHSYTYDNKRNYTNQDLAFMYLTLGRAEEGGETVLSKNNLLSAKAVLFDQTLDMSSYAYFYNRNGYPIGYIFNDGNQEYNPRQMKYE